MTRSRDGGKALWGDGMGVHVFFLSFFPFFFRCFGAGGPHEPPIEFLIISFCARDVNQRFGVHAIGVRAKLTSLRNRGELAEGWYEPDTLRKARASAAVAAQASRVAGAENPQPTAGDLSDDDVGPAPPRGRVGGSQVIGEQKQEQQQQQRAGPVIPSIQDLELRQGAFTSLPYISHYTQLPTTTHLPSIKPPPPIQLSRAHQPQISISVPP